MNLQEVECEGMDWIDLAQDTEWIERICLTCYLLGMV